MGGQDLLPCEGTSVTQLAEAYALATLLLQKSPHVTIFIRDANYFLHEVSVLALLVLLSPLSGPCCAPCACCGWGLLEARMAKRCPLNCDQRVPFRCLQCQSIDSIPACFSRLLLLKEAKKKNELKGAMAISLHTFYWKAD